MTFLNWLDQQGGICSLEAALDHIPRDRLEEMKGTMIWTPLRGWVARTGVADERTRALARGGVMSCVSAFAAAGAWVPDDARLHIRIHRSTHSVRTADAAFDDEVVAHRLRRKHAQPRPANGSDSLQTALLVARCCVPPIDLVTIAADAVAKKLMTPEQLHTTAEAMPARVRSALLAVSGESGSCSEARLAEVLRCARIRFRQQVEVVPGVRVDFVIGRRLVVECDSRKWHGGDVYYERDRRRDAKLAAAGYVVMRVSYQQVMHELDAVLEQIRAVLSNRAVR